MEMSILTTILPIWYYARLYNDILRNIEELLVFPKPFPYSVVLKMDMGLLIFFLSIKCKKLKWSFKEKYKSCEPVSIMADDGLATGVARTSAGMMLA